MPKVMIDEHFYHQSKDIVPEPEQWVRDNWLRSHANSALDAEAEASGTPRPSGKEERAAKVQELADGMAASFRVHKPEWREVEASENGGYWVVFSEASL